MLVRLLDPARAGKGAQEVRAGMAVLVVRVVRTVGGVEEGEQEAG